MKYMTTTGCSQLSAGNEENYHRFGMANGAATVLQEAARPLQTKNLTVLTTIYVY